MAKIGCTLFHKSLKVLKRRLKLSKTYHTLLNCDGLDYWGKDACGDDLTGKIRHHKFPDRNLIDHIVNASLQAQQYQSDVYMLINVLSCTGGTTADTPSVKDI